MQNQAAVEALYSATFVEDYLDTVENLPNELQQHLSALREMDSILYKDFLRGLDSLIDGFEKESSVSGQRQILQKIQKGLILAKSLGDEKLILAQAMADTIENRSRMLEHDSKNLEFGDNENEDPVVHNNPKPSYNHNNKTSSSSGNVSGCGLKSTGPGRAAKRQVDDKGEKTAIKRRKKQNHEKQKDDQDEEESNASSTNTGKGSSSKSRGGSSVGNSNTSSRKPSNKRRAANSKKVEKDDSDHDLDPNLVDIDPDEPTYCLCDQVSYGEMIGCDNDLCPIEWFHFQCVHLTNKPKGKWYCPKCRGDKPTVMKPKSQFLKELEKFNKEKEEKMMRQNS